jgi:hypothetical protein
MILTDYLLFKAKKKNQSSINNNVNIFKKINI